MKLIAGLAALAAMAFASSPAEADWKEATSAHFIVYSEGPEAQLREFATKLEKFDFVLRAYHHVTAPSSPIKLRVYLLPSIQSVGRMAGNEGVAGYYVSESRGLMMVGTHSTAASGSADARTRNDEVDLDYESILLHEYTHHFMFQYFPATYRPGISEGFAEFWGATRFLPGNIVEVGRLADYRFGSFSGNRWLPVRKLLTAQSYAEVPELDLLYAQGWLLVRYTFDQPERRRQLQAYLKAINDGASYEAAMNKAFGNPDQLNSELFDYAGHHRFNVLQLPFKPISVGDIALRHVSPAEDSLIPLEIELSQGILQRDAKKFADKVRGSASRFPDDPYALALVAEAERLAGNLDAANAAADRLLAKSPNDPHGLLQKALVDMERLRAAGSKDPAAWNAARQYLVRASRIRPQDPLILKAYYDSYSGLAALPPEPAQAALYHAMELAPSDSELRYKLASDFEKRDMIEDAISIIRPSAFVLPHRKGETEKEKKKREELEDKYRGAGEHKHETAREMLERLERKRAAKHG